MTMKTPASLRRASAVKRLHPSWILGRAMLITLLVSFVSSWGQSATTSTPQSAASGSDNAEVTVPSHSVPFSVFASSEAKQAYLARLSAPRPELDSDIAALRKFYGKYNDSLALRMKELYKVKTTFETVGGIRIESIVPEQGVSLRNAGRILINLHGGGFMWGEGSGGEVESIPIASIGRIKVITVSYRMAPENRFPAASEDVAAVYKALLQRYRPRNIGIYGCSAGGILTAESVAWFEKVDLPMPGAIGTFCGSISGLDGDSDFLTPELTGSKTPTFLSSLSYFAKADLQSRLVTPSESPSLLAKFPPTLLIAGSRDFAASSLFASQAALTKAGVEAELHVWDGMWHAFFMDPDLPESQQVYAVIVKFFDHHLSNH